MGTLIKLGYSTGLVKVKKPPKKQGSCDVMKYSALLQLTMFILAVKNKLYIPFLVHLGSKFFTS